MESKSVLRQSTLTIEEYVTQIRTLRSELNSEDTEVRTRARSEIKLKLQRLIERMMFNADRSVAVHFKLPSGNSVCLEVPHQGEPVLSGKLTASTTMLWRAVKGGLLTAKRLGVEGLPV